MNREDKAKKGRLSQESKKANSPAGSGSPQSLNRLSSPETAFAGATGSIKQFPTKARLKRARDDTDDDSGDDLPSAEELSKMTRSERKRHREKKRRNDVNKGFDDLMTLLLEIDPDVRLEAEERARRGQWKGSIGAQEENLLSRVDLISRTVQVLSRVHRENEERKLIIESLTTAAARTGTRSGEVSKVICFQPSDLSLENCLNDFMSGSDFVSSTVEHL
jgi:hypothetical protein